jgi:hypothetical protein
MESKELLSANGWMSGYSRRMNHRAMAIQIQNGVPVASPGSSVQVSRYSYDDDTQPATDADSEVEKISVAGTTFPMWNHFNINNYDTGKSPFDGDYTDIRALTPNTFITAFTDNRYVVPATTGTGGVTPRGRISRITDPGPAAPIGVARPDGNGGADQQRADRHGAGQLQDLRGRAGRVRRLARQRRLDQPTQQCVEFPFTAWNNTDSDKRYKIWLSAGAPPPPSSAGQPNASLARHRHGPGLRLSAQVGGLNIFQHSSNSANVYAFDGNADGEHRGVPANRSANPQLGEACTGFTPTTIDASVTFNSSLSAPPSGSQGTRVCPERRHRRGPQRQGPERGGRNVEAGTLEVGTSGA